MAHYIDYTKRLLNRLDFAVERAMADYQEACKRAGEATSGAHSMSQAMPGLYGLSHAVGYSMTLSAGKAFCDAVRANFEELLRVEHFSKYPGDINTAANAIESSVLPKVLSELRSELLGNKKKQLVNGWQFALRPASDFSTSELIDLTPEVANSAIPNVVMNNPTFGLQSSNVRYEKANPEREGRRESKTLYDHVYLSKIAEPLPQVVESEVHLNTAAGATIYKLPKHYKAYFGTKLQVMATRVPHKPGESIVNHYDVVITAHLPDNTVLTRVEKFSVDSQHTFSKIYTYGGAYDNAYSVGAMLGDVWKKLQSEYQQDVETLGFWHEGHTPLINADGVTLDLTTRVLDPRTGSVYFGVVQTWPDIFTHIALREIQKGFNISPMRQYGQELTGEERLGLYAQFAQSFAKENHIDRGWSNQCSWQENIVMPTKWSVSTEGSREPTAEELAEGTYLLINVPGNGYGRAALAQIKFYPHLMKLEFEPLDDNVFSPRSEYYLLKQALHQRNSDINRREEQAKART